MKPVTTKFAKTSRLFAASAMVGIALAATAPAHAGAGTIEPEESDVSSLESPKPNWFYIQRGFVLGGTAIYDANTGKYVAQVETPTLGDMAIDPAGKHYYVAESVWSHRLRGTRQDFVAVYDANHLKSEGDIDIPGRILVGGRKNNFITSDDGKTLYVYNFDPVSSVNVVDLVKRKFVKNFELPGCADLIPNPGVGLSALCSDGSLATISLTGSKVDITRTEPFFGATTDPIFDNFPYDKAKKQVVFLTYTGLIRTVGISAKPTIGEAFSIQEAAGIRKGDTKALDINWLPGGGQPMALNRKTGHLYVLMHMGEFWSHKAPGTEVWDVDLATKKVVKRLTLPTPASAVEVTQEASPKLIIAGGESETAIVLDAATGEVKYKIENAGAGPIYTVE